MKKTLLTLSLLLISMGLYAQEDFYVVLHVKGKVSLVKTGQLLKPSDRISAEEKVSFENTEALVAVLHPTKGRRIMRMNEQAATEGSELIAFVKNTLVAGTGRASTRAGKFSNFMEIDSFFTANPLTYYKGQVALMGSRVTFPVSTEAFPLDGQNFFFARYEYNGETINKKLGFEGNAFILDQSTLYQIDGSPIDPSQTSNLQLYYRHAATKKSEFITKVKPNFIPEAELKNEIGLLMEYYLQGKEEQFILEELVQYFADSHGKADKDQLMQFLDKHLPNWKN